MHLYPSNFLHESRIEKITETLSSIKIFREIWLIGVREANLPAYESFSNVIKLFRVGRATMKKSFILKIFSFVQFYIHTFLLLRRENLACVNAHSLSVLPLAAVLKYWKGCVLIYDTHELETETHSLCGLRKKFAKIVEKFFIKKTDKIFCVSDEIAGWYASNYNVEKPITILNSPPAELLPQSDYLKNKFNLVRNQKIAIYLGVIEPGRGIEAIVDSFQRLEDDSVIVVFVGYGTLVNYIKSSPGFGRTIFFHPAVARTEIVHLAASADIGLCLVSPTSLSYEYCMPNKLFEYLMSGLPVVVSQSISLNNFIERHKVGFVLREFSYVDIAKQVCLYLDFNLDGMKKNARKFALANSWETQAVKIKMEYQKIFQEP